MFKFFRRIRYSLIGQSKLRKYFFYAAGEIFLVVIGILIALQINNWNQKRIGSIKEKIYLEELLNDLKHNVDVFESNKAWESKMIRNTEVILKHIGGDLAWHDSIGQALSYLRHMEEYFFVTATYESLNAGGFDLINSDKLRRNIIYLFDKKYKVDQNRILLMSKTMLASREELFQKYTYWDQEKYTVIPKKLLYEVEDSPFFSMLTLRLQMKNYAVIMYQQAIDQTNTLIEQIVAILGNQAKESL